MRDCWLRAIQLWRGGQCAVDAVCVLRGMQSVRGHPCDGLKPLETCLCNLMRPDRICLSTVHPCLWWCWLEPWCRAWRAVGATPPRYSMLRSFSRALGLDARWYSLLGLSLTKISVLSLSGVLSLCLVSSLLCLSCAIKENGNSGRKKMS